MPSLSPFALALTLLLPAEADPGPEVTGQWMLTDSPAQFEQFKAAAVKKTLDSMSFAVRALAGSRVEGAVTVCARYAIDMAPPVMKVTCDSKTAVTINLDGSPSTYTSEGHTYTVTASVRGDAVTASFKGEDATQVTVYRFTGSQLAVEKTINSPYFGEPLRWTNHYQR